MCAREQLYKEINKIPIVDIHTHVNFQNPFAKNAWGILGYHYFTEMAHSQGMAREIVVSEDYSDEEKVEELSKYLPGMKTTEPYRWLVHLSKKLFGFPYSRLGEDNWKSFWKCVENKAKNPARLEQICKLSNIEIISTTNPPWENLEGIENHKNNKGKSLFIPAFRVDSLLQVDKTTLKNLEGATDKEISNLKDFEDAIVNRLSYFREKGTRALAVSLYSNPITTDINRKDAEKIFDKILKKENLNQTNNSLKFHAYMLDFLSGLCEEHKLPFQLMVGAERDIYLQGIPDGKDIFQPNGSLWGLKYLLNKYPRVKFPISILSFTEDKELATYSRIFPNVYASGHWWFENTYESIKLNLKNRLKLAPHTKLIGQYSDAYTIELIDAKIDMYRKVLSDVLGEYLKEKTIDEQEALNIAQDLLYNGQKRVFGL